MMEFIILEIYLSVAFVLAPLMTNHFFLNNSKIYSDAHKVSLLILFISWSQKLIYLSIVWPIFCAFGFILYLKNEKTINFSMNGIASFIPFLFSLISSTWFFAGVTDLHLLGYSRAWSFYAALHGSFLGWIFVGCLAFLSKRPNSNKFYLWGCYLILILFLFVAFGIDGIPYIKRIGVAGLSILTPVLIGLYTVNLKGKYHPYHYLSVLSL